MIMILGYFYHDCFNIYFCTSLSKIVINEISFVLARSKFGMKSVVGDDPGMHVTLTLPDNRSGP